MKLADILFKVFNIDRTKNREVTWIELFEIKINEWIDIAVINLNGTDIFLGHD